MDETSRGSAGSESLLPREVDFMRWLVRDIGVFLYGCVFASKYIFLGGTAGQPKKQDGKRNLRFYSVVIVPRH
jgi:hypothetical protein